LSRFVPRSLLSLLPGERLYFGNDLQLERALERLLIGKQRRQQASLPPSGLLALGEERIRNRDREIEGELKPLLSRSLMDDLLSS